MAKRLIRETVLKQGIARHRLTIHSHRRPSISSQTVAQLLATSGITKSHSRPHVSNENPFSESQFKTLKYRPAFPERLSSFDHALDFCGGFSHWHNFQHYHCGLGLLALATVDFGIADQVLAARRRVLKAACTAHPGALRPPASTAPGTLHRRVDQSPDKLTGTNHPSPTTLH